MRNYAPILLTFWFVSAFLVLSTASPLFAQEKKGGNEFQELRRENEALQKEIQDVRRLLDELKEQLQRAETVGASASVNTELPPSSRPAVSSSVARENRRLELEKKVLESALLSQGDIGLVALLRFEKANACREAGMLDKAAEELRKIIVLNLAEEVTNAARWTLVEILQEQKQREQAIAELEKILAAANKPPEKKKDAIYGIINLSGDDPGSRIQRIDSLIERLIADSVSSRAKSEEVPAPSKAGPFAIPEENLQIFQEMKGCAANLRGIYAAIKKYEKDKGKLPDWLSDLVPDYLGKEALLCPDDPDYTTIWYPDPKLPCSYSYEFSPARAGTSYTGGRDISCREWKTQQLKFFGDVVPVVRCVHHSPELNVSWGGQVYMSGMRWEADLMSDYYRGVEFGESSEPTPPGGSTVNRVLSLDGKTGYVQVADSESLHSFKEAITIEAWVKAASFYTGNGEVNSVVRKNIAPGAENFLLRFRILDGERLAEMNPGVRVGIVQAPYEFTTGTWYHLAGTYDGKAMTVYVDGVKVRGEPFSGPMNIDKSDLFIGKGDPDFSSGEYFHGAVDEIRIWNVARSQKEIQAAMNTPLTGKEQGLVAYWNFDDGTAKDLSAHGNDGRLDGDARIVESPRPAVEPEKESAEPPGAEPRELTTQERLEVLEALWTRLSEIYPALEYKGIYGREWIGPAEKRIREAKSDEEFYRILLELMATLNDTHTRIISYPGQPRLESPPVELNRVEGKVAVIRAESDTGLSPGDIILSVDGRPVEGCLAEKMKRACNSTERGRVREACGQLLRGAPGTEVTVTAQGANGQTRNVVLRGLPNPEFWREPVISSRQLSDSIGYIRISRWAGDSLVEKFDEALETFKSTEGIVIDVRGNGGGNGELADLVNGRLTDKPVISSIDFWRKAGSDEYRKEIGWVRPRGSWTYKGRIAVLMDEASMSSCEHFVSGVEAMGNVLLVGAPTNGAGGGPTTVQLPDGTRVAISRALGLRVNGIVFEAHGIPPHLFSTPTLNDLRAGRDAALDIAKEWILSGKDIPSRSQPLPGGVKDSTAPTGSH